MTETGFVKAQSDKLPKIDALMVTAYFTSNPDYTSAEIKGVKAASYSLAATMEHGASERVKEQSHTVMPVKTEVDKAAPSTACRGVQSNVNYTEEEPGLVVLEKSEAALLVKEEVVEDVLQDIAEQQCVHGPLLADPGNTLNIKEELGAIDVGPTVLQLMDTPGTTNQKDASFVKPERTINHDKIDPVLCGGVKEEIIEDEQRGSLTPPDSIMEQPAKCTVLHSLHQECLETICRVQLRRLDTFQCEVCDAVYVDGHKLLQHVQEVHRPGPKRSLHQNVKSPQISKKGQQCATADTGDQHSNKAAQSKQRAQSQLYSCDKCGKTFASNKSLLAHYRNIHSTESHECTKCDRKFPSKRYLYNHTSTAHSEQQYECAFCKKICSSRATLYTHVYYVHRPRPAVSSPVVHTCDYCHKTYTSKSGLICHKDVVHTKVLYRCSECNKEYKGKHLLQEHIKKKHEGSKPHVYTCDYCKKMFTKKGTIRNHIDRVHSSGSYKCHQCNNIFKCKAYLMMHKTKVHPAESRLRHTCTNCGQNFSSKWYWKKHEKSCTCTRPTASDTSAVAITSRQQPTKRTATKRSLTTESRLRHTCTNCGQNFSSKWHCQRHEKRGKCTRPTAGNTSAAASTSRQQRNVVIVKEETADGELELGPVVFQHMDCNYRPYKLEPGLD